MIQILHIQGLQYEGETPEQAEERDRRTVEANRRMREEWEDGQRQRLAPMESMKQWARDRGITQHNVKCERTPREEASPKEGGYEP